MSLTITSPTSPPKYLHGINMRFLIGPASGTVQAFAVEQIDFNHDIDLDEITNSESGGWEELLEGIQRATLDVTFIYDLANSAMASPQLFKAGTTANVHMIVDANTSPNLPVAGSTSDWTGQVKVKTFKFPTGPKGGPVRVVASCRSNKAFTIPGV